MNNDFRKQGWVKLHRKIIQSSIFANPEFLKLWILCLAKANHTKQQVFLEGVADPVEVKPGQFITGRFSLHREYYPFDAPKNKTAITVWRWLENLSRTGMLNIKTSNKYSLVEIVNWDIYQNEGGEINQNDQQMNNKRTSNDQQMNNKRSSNDHQMITEKNDKNVENEQNENNEREGERAPASEVFSSDSDAIPDSRNEVINYFTENDSTEKLGKIFYSNYVGKGWQINGDKIRNWRAIADMWILKGEKGKQSYSGNKSINANQIMKETAEMFSEDQQGYKTKGDRHVDVLRSLGRG